MMFLALSLLSFTFITAAQYHVIEFNNTKPVGPDGPWIPITLRPGYPLQFVDFYPTFNASTNWYVASLNCNNASQQCAEAAQNYYDSTDFSAENNPLLSQMKNSSAVPFGQIYEPTAQLLNASESFGHWHEESIAISDQGNPNYFWGPSISQVISNYTNVNFPNGASYVPLSLLTLDPTTLFLPTTVNESQTYSSLLQDLWTPPPPEVRSINSFSWTMHIGSYDQKINASLIVSGYDQTRVVGHAGTFSSSGVSLTDISLGASSGGYSWTSKQLGQNYLDYSNGSPPPLNVSLTPSVPYLYLPAAVCSSLASTLPISYNSGFNLYLWDTNSPAYNQITTSPTFLNFTFSSQDGTPLSVLVPFALLNLTLDKPLVKTPTSYFPCSPSNTSTFALGRAFLQAALIGQHYQTSTFFLAQAPGPNIPSTAQIKILEPTDTSLAPNPDSPTWSQTWSTALKALSTSNSSSPANSPNSHSSSSLSGGAIAGIIIGVLAFLALVALATLFILRRRRRTRTHGPMPADPSYAARPEPKPHKNHAALPMAEVPTHEEPNELAGRPQPVEAPAPAWGLPGESGGWRVAEMPGDEGFEGRGLRREGVL